MGEDLKSLQVSLLLKENHVPAKTGKFQMQNECFGELKTQSRICEENGF